MLVRNLTMAVVSATVLLHSPVLGGAFGIQFGAPLSSLQIVKKLEKNGRYIVKVPIPNDEFESYSVWASARYGVCKIFAVGKDHRNDKDGSDIRIVFNEFHEKLSNKYGASKDFNFLHVDALWNKPSEFSWSLYKNERSLTSFWDRESGSNMPSDTSIISLEANATDGTTTYITLSYESQDILACDKETKARGDSAL